MLYSAIRYGNYNIETIIMRIPTINTINKKAIAGEVTPEYIATVRTAIIEKRDKLQGELDKLKELDQQVLVIESIISATLASSIDSEPTMSSPTTDWSKEAGIVEDSHTDHNESENQKVM